MKTSLLVFLLVIASIINAQKRELIPDQKTLISHKKSEALVQPEKHINLNSDCEYNLEDFTGEFDFYDQSYPEENSVVSISLHPEIENALVVDGLWGLSIEPEPIIIVLYPDNQSVYWDQQPISPDLWTYGPGNLRAGNGSFDPCEMSISMDTRLCVDAGCFQVLPILLIKKRETDPPKDCYWISGSGSWKDLGHWATTSGGGTNITALPDENDNVYFDAHSFATDGDSVTGPNVFCNDFSFLSSRKVKFALNQLTLSSGLVINENFTPDIGRLVFTTTGATEFRTHNKSFSDITFQGTGSIIFADTVRAASLLFYSGSVSLPVFVDCDMLGAYGNVSEFNMQGSYIFSVVFENFTEPAVFTADHSTLDVTSISGNNHQYDYILFDDSYNQIRTSLQADSLIMEGSNYLYLYDSAIVTVNYFDINGSEENYITVRGYPWASFSKAAGEINTEYVIYENVSASGGAVFNAGNCIAKGNSTGWTGIGKYQVINYEFPGNIPLMDTVILISASASSGLPMVFELVKGDGTLNGNEFTPTGTGQVEIRMTQPGAKTDTAIYAPAFDSWSTSEFGASVYFEVYNGNRPFSLYNYKEACMVLGQDDFTGLETGVDSIHFMGALAVAVSSQDMLAVNTRDEGGDGRVLIWKTLPTEIGQPADIVLGRYGFSSTISGQTDTLMIRSRGLAFSPDGNKLIVSDQDRLLIWNSIPEESGVPADVILGTPGAPISANTFNWIQGVVTTPDEKLIIGDDNRLLIFNKIPASSAATADVVVFQSDFTTVENGTSDRRISDFVRQLALSPDGRLFVPIPNENRTLVFNKVPTENDTPADYVLGQDDLFSGGTGTGRDVALTVGSSSVAVRKDGLTAIGGANWVVSKRVLIFKDLPTETGQLPDYVLGQPNLDGLTAQPASDRSFHGSPEGLAFDKYGRLYLAQREEGRILVFNLKDINYIELKENEIESQTTVVLSGDTARITIPASIFTDGGLKGVIEYTATMINGDPLPEWIIFDPENLTFTILPSGKKADLYSGLVELRISADDEHGEEADLELSINTEILSLQDTDRGQVLIYPNPATDYLYIDLDGTIEVTSITIYNSKGQKIRNFDISNLAARYELLVSDYNDGIYFAVIGSAGKQIIRKFVIQK